MKIINKIFLLGITIFAYSNNLTALPLIGAYNVGTGQTYTTLTANGGFFAAVNSNGLLGNVTVNITSNLTENGANPLNQWTEIGLGGYTITIKPSSASEKLISGSIASPMIDLNGADRVTFDGRFGGNGQYLRFRNTNGSNPAFRFINDAQNNVITYCLIESNNTSNISGTILFSTTTGVNGNDNNTISFCDIRDRSDAAGTPLTAIYSSGSNTTTAQNNSNISILNNNIYNFFSDGTISQGVYIAAGSTDWTITGNSFYQTAARNTSGATGWNIIFLGASTVNNFTISNNYFGGSAASCGGTAWTVTGNNSNFIYVVRFALAGVAAASNLNGNTIANFDFTSNPSSNNLIQFAGILVQAGIVNIGSVSGNVIGNTSSNGNIKFTLNGIRTNIILRAIDHRTTGNVNNNSIGSINILGNITGIVNFDAISYQSFPSAPVSILSNTIGSPSTANSIQCIAGVDLVLNGINTSVNSAALTISGNTIANMNNASTGIDAVVRGIIQTRATTAPMTIQNNNVFELSTASLNVLTKPSTCAAIGIMTGSNDTTQMVSGNIVHGIHVTGNNDVFVVGISHTEQVSKGTLQKNKIYDLTNASTTSGPAIYGIDAYWGNWTFINNQVAITNGAASDNPPIAVTHSEKKILQKVEYTDNTNPLNGICPITQKDFDNLRNYVPYDKLESSIPRDVFTNGVMIQAIHDEAEKGCIYYYNTIYVGGSATSGSVNSYCYARPLTIWPTPVTMINNLFYNNRTGGTGIHYAVGNEIVPPSKNWRPGNYNVFIAPNSNAVCSWGAGVNLTISQWRDSSAGDKQTWNTVPTGISPTNLFTSLATGNLNIQSGNSEAWIVSGKGIAIAAVNQDYSGNTRSTVITGGCTDIGSNEFSAAPPSCPYATVNNPPGSGVTSTYTLWGRTICIVQWGTGGSSYPTALNIQYFTGVIHPNSVTGNYGDSYWSITPTGTLTGAAYDITWSFGDNETYTISNPSLNTRLAQYKTSWEVFSVQGTGTYQTELNWAGLTAKTRGLSNFNTFTLTDGAAPLPVSIMYFNAIAKGRSVNLNWSTAWEINNNGFDIERRTQTGNNNFSEWVKTGFAAGYGNSQEQRIYTFADNKLGAGKYQYRLKQIDFNGNSEYFNLASPEIIEIAKPSVFDLHQNYPNPSNPKTKIDYEIPFTAKVTIKVYDFIGREISTLINENKDAGYYTTDFDGSNLASGVYFYRIIVQNSAQNYNKTLKMILIK